MIINNQIWPSKSISVWGVPLTHVSIGNMNQLQNSSMRI